jgi:hypothetical protein
MKVLSVDDGVERLVTAVLNPTGLYEPRVNLVVKLRDDNEVFDRGSRDFGVVAAGLNKACDWLTILKVKGSYAPESLVTLRRFASLRQHTHLCSTTYRLIWQLDRLRLVALEHEPEAAALCKGSDLFLEVSTKLRVCASQLSQQVSKS